MLSLWNNNIFLQFHHFLQSHRSHREDLVCHTYCLEHSAINKPKSLYKKSATAFGIDAEQLGKEEGSG
jgi:hypothetical protein